MLGLGKSGYDGTLHGRGSSVRVMLMFLAIHYTRGAKRRHHASGDAARLKA